MEKKPHSVEPVLDHAVEIPNLSNNEVCFSFRKMLAFMGPGFLMSIAYMDPGNFESDVQAGAVGGYSLLWVLFWSTFFGLIFQLLSAKLGVATGKHLAEHCRENYPKKVGYVLWIMTEIAIIGSDIQEVIGSAIAIQILSHGKVPLFVGVLITALDTFSFLFLENYGIRKLEAFFCSLIGVMAITFGIEYVISAPDQAEVVKGVMLPSLTMKTMLPAVGLLGSTIMPHNIYLHSALVQSRKINPDNKVEVKESNKYFSIECSMALLLSFTVNLFVVSVFASGFYGVEGAEDIGLQSAGEFLAGKYGQYTLYIWAVGLLAAGQSSTMTGTYAGQFAMQGFLQLKIAPWKRVLFTRSVAILPAVFVALTAQQQLDGLDQWLNVLQSVILPFAVLPVLYMTSKVDIMGTFVNGPTTRILLTALGLCLISVNIYFVVAFIVDTDSIVAFVFSSLLGVFYASFVVYLTYKVLHTFKEDKYRAERGLLNPSDTGDI